MYAWGWIFLQRSRRIYVTLDFLLNSLKRGEEGSRLGSLVLWPAGLLGNIWGCLLCTEAENTGPGLCWSCQARIGEISTGGQCSCCFPGVGTEGIFRDALCLKLEQPRWIQRLNRQQCWASRTSPKKMRPDWSCTRLFRNGELRLRAEDVQRVQFDTHEPTCKSKLG